MNIKPILFNTDMVRAILDGSKRVTRRVVKPQPSPFETNPHKVCENIGNETCFYFDCLGVSGVGPYKIPFRVGDILYVRETWQNGFGGTYLYKASARMDLFMTPEGKLVSDIPWRPSIHMPKEAARLFLRVTDVRAERVQDIDDEGAKAEGANWRNGKNVGFEEKMRSSSIERFSKLWNSTIQEADLPLYGWEANPWVWVIGFERISKEATLEGGQHE